MVQAVTTELERRTAALVVHDCRYVLDRMRAPMKHTGDASTECQAQPCKSESWLEVSQPVELLDQDLELPENADIQYVYLVAGTKDDLPESIAMARALRNRGLCVIPGGPATVQDESTDPPNSD